MNDDTGGADYRQAEDNLHEAWELLQEADAKRKERQLEALHEMSKGLDDNFEPTDDDERFTKALEAKYPSLLGCWPTKEKK